jgi:hypothetical protein
MSWRVGGKLIWGARGDRALRVLHRPDHSNESGILQKFVAVDRETLRIGKADLRRGTPTEVAIWGVEPNEICGAHGLKMTLLDIGRTLIDLVRGKEEALFLADEIEIQWREHMSTGLREAPPSIDQSAPLPVEAATDDQAWTSSRLSVLCDTPRRGHRMRHTKIMNVAYDRTGYLLEETVRVEVAMACRGAPATKAQIAKELGRKPGGMTVIDTLDDDGVLRKAGRAPSRGTRSGGMMWLLAPDWEEAVDRAAAALRKGILAADLEIILIKTTDVLSACQLLEDEGSLVAWGAPLKGEQMGLLLCPAHEPDESKTARLLKLLADRDVQPIRLHIPEVMSEPQLRVWAAHIGLGERGSLPSPR